MNLNLEKNNLAICLVSGGMDSLVTAAIAQKENKNLAFLHLNYGQKTEKKEQWCFEEIAKHYQVPKQWIKIIDMSFLKQIGGSSLTDDSIAVADYSADHGPGADKIIPSSYVPFRNTIILSLAVSWAETIGADKLYIGAVYEDASGYPDCRPEYYAAMNKVIEVGAKNNHIKIITPVINMRKSEIAKKGAELNAPFHLSWSCYAREDAACGVCDSCVLRLRGFKEANMIDPIAYLN